MKSHDLSFLCVDDKHKNAAPKQKYVAAKYVVSLLMKLIVALINDIHPLITLYKRRGYTIAASFKKHEIRKAYQWHFFITVHSYYGCFAVLKAQLPAKIDK